MTDGLYQTLHHFAETTNDIVCASPAELFLKKFCEKDRSPSLAMSQSLIGIGGCLQEPALRPRLPVEILDIVFSFLSLNSLKPLLVANSFISTLSTRHIYHTVEVDRPASIVKFLCTVLGNPKLPKLIRSLKLCIGQSLPISNFYTLLHRVLRLTTRLSALTIELPKSHSPLWIFDGCTFRLKQFSSTIICRRPLAAFLETQSHITDLTLRGYQSDSIFMPFIDPLPPSMLVPSSDMFILAPEALPVLKSFNAVHADACIVQAVVQDRPVEIVSIPLFPEMSIAALDAILMSSAPLKRLSIISFDPAPPALLFEALAKRFDQLEALHLVMLMAEYSDEILAQSGVLLSNFKFLKYITFMAATPPVTPFAQTHPSLATPTAIDSDAEEEETNEANVAKAWHRACPSLRTIILPKGKVWFQSSPEGEQTPGTSTVTQRDTNAASMVNNTQEDRGGEPHGQEERWSHL
ncbi:hypothetical protein GALMADRAFT_252348 [Galerina marginata CBS 339.88]|uniref:F-box domain-containing protein n=1 Tax=Galerina marginata (strain CBS 339.88) TaxID=685588 RepID=A0A067T1W4_GALM3|nr:hypothetical protein GALMADRAFT_252348 [Galerina marginata CBS 339.88]